MDPISVLGLIALAGWAFKASSKATEIRTSPALPPEEYRAKVAPSKIGRKAEFDPSLIEILPEYELVRDLIRAEFPLIFVTGSAGTGKSTFIRWLDHVFDGEMILAAPTGMAAISIGGVTLHSLCRLPPGWILKGDIQKNHRRQDIKRAKVLVIDEISMVSANLLDATSAFFRANREVDKPFGGIPVVVVGDLFQLPPVVESNVRKLVERFYGTARFFNARSVQPEYIPATYPVDLRKTYRQSDQRFVDLLSNIRLGHDLASTVAAINQGCEIADRPPPGAVHLAPRNVEVDRINNRRLEEIDKPDRHFDATITNRFRKDRLPSPLKLTLREGAQVLFTKNDSARQWVNGSVGIVKSFGRDGITVEILDTQRVVDVSRVTWEQFEYGWDEATRKISRIVVGTYTQLPLMLAWAITIHKSQGKTIDRVHVDLGAGVFASGQTYVALSRCRSIETLSLSRELRVSDIIVDAEVRGMHDELMRKVAEVPPDVMHRKVRESLGLSAGEQASESTLGS
ncbi:MAG TPA: DEAD/DEAH box helicase [Candidatus Binatia bacterium]